MKTKDKMTRNVISVSPEASVLEASQIMRDINVGILPVSLGNELHGVITDRDIVVRVVAEGVEAKDIKIKDIMSSNVECCREDDDLNNVAKQMESRQIRRLPVVDDENKLVGVISLGDIAVRAGKAQAGEILEKVSEPVK